MKPQFALNSMLPLETMATLGPNYAEEAPRQHKPATMQAPVIAKSVPPLPLSIAIEQVYVCTPATDHAFTHAGTAAARELCKRTKLTLVSSGRSRGAGTDGPTADITRLSRHRTSRSPATAVGPRSTSTWDTRFAMNSGRHGTTPEGSATCSSIRKANCTPIDAAATTAGLVIRLTAQPWRCRTCIPDGL